MNEKPKPTWHRINDYAIEHKNGNRVTRSGVGDDERFTVWIRSADTWQLGPVFRTAEEAKRDASR